MKVLLLSDVPPCGNLKGGLPLAAMTRFLPRDSVCCFIVASSDLHIQGAHEFGNIPMRFMDKPSEDWSWLQEKRILRNIAPVVSLAGETLSEQVTLRELVRLAVKFGREQKVDRVWAVLQSQTTIRMAAPVAQKLGVQLYTHVWDPISGLAKANHIDPVSARRIGKRFDRAIESSKCVAAASEPMAEYYREKYGVPAIAVISGHPASLARKARVATGGTEPLVIGMAGQFYAAKEWQSLMKALSAAGWKVGGRAVRMIVMGPHTPPGNEGPRTTFLGLKSQPDAATILSQCDFLYCPCPFDQCMKEVSHFSFPSNLPLYLASGRPVIFHGPDYSAPARYITQRNCGVVVPRINASAIYNAIHRLILDPEACERMAANAQDSFLADFTLDSMQDAFCRFIDAPPRDGTAYFDHTASRDAIGHPPQSRNTLSLRLMSGAFSLMQTVFSVSRSLMRRIVRPIVKYAVAPVFVRLPRIRALLYEIKILHAEKIQLENKVAELAEALEQLKKSTLREAESAESCIAGLDADKEKDPAKYRLFRIQQLLSRQYPNENFLIIMPSQQDRELPDKPNSIKAWPYPYTCRKVSGLEIEDWPSNEIRNDDWKTVKDMLSEEIIGQLLRKILQFGSGRIVVTTPDLSALAYAVAVSELVAARVTVCCRHAELFRKTCWADQRSSIDFIDYSTA